MLFIEECLHLGFCFVFRETGSGLVVWLCTVALGMILRVVSGQGTAVAFIIVAVAFLGLFLLGWRVLARLLTR